MRTSLSYNGTFTTCAGLKVVTPPADLDLSNDNDVFDGLWDNTEKWEVAKGIKVKEEKGVQTWYIGGWAAEQGLFQTSNFFLTQVKRNRYESKNLL